MDSVENSNGFEIVLSIGHSHGGCWVYIAVDLIKGEVQRALQFVGISYI